MTKHTPGPWRIHLISEFGANRENYCVTAEINPNDQPTCVVAEVYGNNWSREQELADARLIAAAPDLLAALDRAYLQIIEFLNEGDFKRNIEFDAGYIVDAIAKAEGK